MMCRNRCNAHEKPHPHEKVAAVFIDGDHFKNKP